MNDTDWLADRFETNRPRLRSVAYRMLGSFGEADDAVQETWLRLSRTETHSIDNLDGWLTTVVSRVCLDMLRTRTHRREEPLTPADWEPAVGADPEGEAELADSVGLAMLVVLETLGPAERLAFVLHDMFGVSFDEIGPIVGRSPAAARQLASRARRRVRGTTVSPSPQLREHQRVVEAFLAASRNGDLDQLLELLDPNVVLRTDRVLIPPRAPSEIHGSAEVAQQFDGLAQLAREALVNGAVGIVVAPKGRLKLVITVAIVGGKITEIEVIADPDRLPDLELAALN